MAVGGASDKPNLAQQHWMATLLNTIRYFNPRWERLFNDDKLMKEQESIRIRVDEEDNTSIIYEIGECIKTRHPPTLICGMLHNGGCTKAFKSRQELSEYIY